MIVVLVMGGVQMTMLGILGEYLWRALDEARRRPRYNIERWAGVRRLWDGRPASEWARHPRALSEDTLSFYGTFSSSSLPSPIFCCGWACCGRAD
jgi:hypothetical protein